MENSTNYSSKAINPKATYPFVLKAFQITKSGDIFENEKTIYTAAQEAGFREAYPLNKFRIEDHFLQERLPAEKPITQPTASNLSSMNYIMRLVTIVPRHPLWSAIIAGLVVYLVTRFVF